MAALDLLNHPVRPGDGWQRFATHIRGEGTAARRAWRSTYVRRAVLLDVTCAGAAAVLAYLVWFRLAAPDPVAPPLWSLLALPALWLPAMYLARSYEERFLWVGPEEYRRVFAAAVLLLAGVGTFAWAFRIELARGFVVLALPLVTVLTLVQRLAHRHWLHRQRCRGRHQQTTLLVGHRDAVAALDEEMQRALHQGYRVVGCCLPPGQLSLSADAFNGLPVLGGLDDVAEVVHRFGIDTVAVLPSRELDGHRLRRLGWQLEDEEAELLVAPAIIDVVGPRIHIRPVAGLPVLHVERPELTGVRRLAKACLDRAAALMGLVVLAPLLVAIAVAVRVTGPGPVLFRQERIGLRGEPFTMLKFRTMVVDAQDRLADLEADSDGNGPLFKKRNDPRVTSAGRFLRRYSLDELPQLVNVLRGDMSLVGPRPPLAREVEHYGHDMRRRFLVKPGLTGLWQVSGRSDLSWEESVRVDVRYVENWSLALDIMILWKTLGAVLRGAGAY